MLLAASVSSKGRMYLLSAAPIVNLYLSAALMDTDDVRRKITVQDQKKFDNKYGIVCIKKT